MSSRWMLTRAAVSKYHGLKKLELYGLNHPNWMFVSTANDVPTTPWDAATVGWTVRCCSPRSYDFGLPSSHMLQFSKIRSVVSRFARQVGRDFQFAIYPSWEFDVSGCCLMVPDRLTVEAVKGDIAPLLRGHANPDVVLEAAGPAFRRFEVTHGCADLVCPRDRRVLISSCQRLKVASTLVLEWTKTRPGKIVFHDWLELL